MTGEGGGVGWIGSHFPPVAETFGDYISKFSQFGDYIWKFGQIWKIAK